MTRSNNKRAVPHNTEAEASLLGAAMLDPEALEVMLLEVTAEDWYLPRHQIIAEAIANLYRGGINRPDPVLVWDEIDGMGLADQVGGSASVLTDLIGDVPATRNAAHYARLVLEAASARRLINVGTEITGLGYEAGADVELAIDRAKAMVASVDVPMGSGVPSPNVSEFMAAEVTFDWLVTGLIERMDRLVITGGEGAGKSTLLRQVSVQLASGIHPFSFYPIEPQKCLVLDMENSKRQMQRKLEPMVKVAGDKLNPDNLRLESRPEGIDLLTRADTRWLVEKVAANRPDVLITGPIYKLHSGATDDETAARRVALLFDSIRTRYNCALIIEAHSPHGQNGSRDLRPIGSSLWLRWPEFGYGLKKIPDEPNTVMFSPWRGPRDERAWPSKLVRGGIWPWQDANLSGSPTKAVGRPVSREEQF